MSNLFLKPAAGLIVRDPESGSLLPQTGAWKTDNEFWRRRLRDGDVIESKSADVPARRPGTGGDLSAPHHKRSDKR